MNTKYIIEEQTLTNIADSLRELHGTSDPIPVEDFAGLIVGVDPSVVDYMRVTDYLDYPAILDESNYTKEEVERCTALYTFYLEMEDIT